MSYISFQVTDGAAPVSDTTRVQVRATKDNSVIADTALGTIASLGNGFFRTSTKVKDAIEYSVYVGPNADQPVLGQQARSHVGFDAERQVASGLLITIMDPVAERSPFEVACRSRGPFAAGIFLHSYKDASDDTPEYHPFRLDNVGVGGSMVYLVNANNQNYRPDLNIGTSDFLWCFEAAADGGGNPQSAQLFRIDKDANLVWYGDRRAGGTYFPQARFRHGGNPTYQEPGKYLFEFRSDYAVTSFMSWCNGSATPNLTLGTEASGTLLAFTAGSAITSSWRFRSNQADIVLDVANTAKRLQVKYGGITSWYRHTYYQGTTPTAVIAGELWFDNALGKPFWWSGSAWVDATGTIHP